MPEEPCLVRLDLSEITRSSASYVTSMRSVRGDILSTLEYSSSFASELTDAVNLSVTPPLVLLCF